MQRELGLRSQEAHAMAYLAAVLLWRGDEARALAVARPGARDKASRQGRGTRKRGRSTGLGKRQEALGRMVRQAPSFMAGGCASARLGYPGGTHGAGRARARRDGARRP
jgi:hypothetical protein